MIGTTTSAAVVADVRRRRRRRMPRMVVGMENRLGLEEEEQELNTFF